MSNTKHTPGPWEIHNNIGRKSELGVIADAAPYIIAIMGNRKDWPAEADANARLIAAAPDLLEACKAALNHVCGMQVRDIIAAAIAKAEGNAPGWHRSSKRGESAQVDFTRLAPATRSGSKRAE